MSVVSETHTYTVKCPPVTEFNCVSVPSLISESSSVKYNMSVRWAQPISSACKSLKPITKHNVSKEFESVRFVSSGLMGFSKVGKWVYRPIIQVVHKLTVCFVKGDIEY